MVLRYFSVSRRILSSSAFLASSAAAAALACSSASITSYSSPYSVETAGPEPLYLARYSVRATLKSGLVSAYFVPSGNALSFITSSIKPTRTFTAPADTLLQVARILWTLLSDAIFPVRIALALCLPFVERRS